MQITTCAHKAIPYSGTHSSISARASPLKCAARLESEGAASHGCLYRLRSLRKSRNHGYIKSESEHVYISGSVFIRFDDGSNIQKTSSGSSALEVSVKRQLVLGEYERSLLRVQLAFPYKRLSWALASVRRDTAT